MWWTHSLEGLADRPMPRRRLSHNLPVAIKWEVVSDARWCGPRSRSPWAGCPDASWPGQPPPMASVTRPVPAQVSHSEPSSARPDPLHCGQRFSPAAPVPGGPSSPGRSSDRGGGASLTGSAYPGRDRPNAGAGRYGPSRDGQTFGRGDTAHPVGRAASPPRLARGTPPLTGQKDTYESVRAQAEGNVVAQRTNLPLGFARSRANATFSHCTVPPGSARRGRHATPPALSRRRMG